MTNSAPPPHVPQSWQPAPEAANPPLSRPAAPYPPHAPRSPAPHYTAPHSPTQGETPPPFDPRRAMAGSPPPAQQMPARQTPGHTGPVPTAPPPYPDAAAQGGMDRRPRQSGPAYGGAPFSQNTYNPQSYPPAVQPAAYDYSPAPAPAADPMARKASVLSRLTGRKKAANSGPVDRMTEAPAEPANARKPFFMGLLTGVVLMLILGQVFRAANSGPDYAALPATQMTITEVPASDEPEAVAFLDKVEGLD